MIQIRLIKVILVEGHHMPHFIIKQVCLIYGISYKVFYNILNVKVPLAFSTVMVPYGFHFHCCYVSDRERSIRTENIET